MEIAFDSVQCDGNTIHAASATCDIFASRPALLGYDSHNIGVFGVASDVLILACVMIAARELDGRPKSSVPSRAIYGMWRLARRLCR